MANSKGIFFSEENSIRAVYLADWVLWASPKENTEYAVVLPMIQRGSVWAPHKILDFWDTLFRDMPIGAFAASETENQIVIPTGRHKTRKSKPNDISLIDGQQRTLAMMTGWCDLENTLRPVALWIDLAKEPPAEYLFRLWATTKAQPFGYESAEGGVALGKLSRDKLRVLNALYSKTDEKIDAQTLWKETAFMPWEATLALFMPEVLSCKNSEDIKALALKKKKEKEDWLISKLATVSAKVKSGDLSTSEAAFWGNAQKQLQTKLNATDGIDNESLEKRVAALFIAIEKVRKFRFPIIQVKTEHLATDAPNNEDEETDPPLAILFKRIGSSGEDLSTSDYVYAVIKHLAPGVYDMVESMLEVKSIKAIFSPTTLVMTAVRMAVLEMIKKEALGENNNKNTFNDTAEMSKGAFARLIRKAPGFISEFESYINKKGKFQSCLKNTLDAIAYNKDNFNEGLPNHALRLVRIPLLETILAWQTLKNPSCESVNNSKLAMVRFLLQGYLCVLKEIPASQRMVKGLMELPLEKNDLFPDQDLLTPLMENVNGNLPLAYNLPSPDTLKGIDGLISTPDNSKGLRGWQRFDILRGLQRFDIKEPLINQRYADLYKRWWNRSNGHIHLMLLWLQRDYVSNFDDDALAGMTEETPYDFDHLVPSAHWSNWTGGGEDALVKFQQDGGGSYYYTGNCIGNVHVLDSSTNRSFGDKPLQTKLKEGNFAANGLLDGENENTNWDKASPSDGIPRQWTLERALAFQKAVEQRTFALYKRFYEDLGYPSL